MVRNLRWMAIVLSAVLVASFVPSEMGVGAAAGEAGEPPAGSTTGRTTGFTTSSCHRCTNAGWMVLSDDARYVTYLAGETYDLWQFDRSTGETTRITEGDRDTLGFFVSGDGRSVLFTSDATNLVEGQVGGPRDAYFWDRDTGTITSLTGRTPNVAQRFHHAEALSADGRFAVFSSDEPLLPGVTDGIRNLYMWDRVTGEITAITNGDAGSSGSSEWLDGDTVGVLISNDGRFVTFSSAATNLVGEPTVLGNNLYQWDRSTATTTRVTNGVLSSEAVGASSDGRYVTFTSRSPGLVPDVVDRNKHVYQWDRVTGDTTAVAVEDTDTTILHISSDGSHVVVGGPSLRVWGRASGALVPLPPEATRLWATSDDTSLLVVSGPDLLLKFYDRSAGTVVPVSRGPILDFPSDDVAISTDGSTVTWTSYSRAEVPGVSRYFRIPYQWDRSTGDVIALVSPDTDARVGAQTADGSTVILSSAAHDLDDRMPDPGLDGVNGYIWQRDVQPTRPAAPWTTALEPGDRSISIEWHVPVPNGSGPIVGYDVEVSSSLDPTRVTAVGADATAATIGGLTNDTEVRARVRARTLDGPGPWSAHSLPATPSTTPDPPTQVTALPLDGYAEVSWQAPPDDGGSPVLYYEVQALVGGIPSGSALEVMAPFTGAPVGLLENGVAYRFVVRAKKTGAWSAWSEPSDAVTPSMIPPDLTGPTISPLGVPASWTNKPVTVSFKCTDSPAGVATCPPAQTFREGARRTVTATDKYGNTSSLTLGPLKIDQTPPALTIATTQRTYRRDETLNLGCRITDVRSGLKAQSNTCPPNGTPAAQLGLGDHQFHLLAADNAGNQIGALVNVTVVK